MSNIELGLWSFPVLLLLIFLRMPIGLAMLIVGVVRQLPHHQELEPQPRAVQVADLLDLLELLVRRSCRCSC